MNSKQKPDCQPIAYQCQNFEMFLEGRCNDCDDAKCQAMGINPNYFKGQLTANDRTASWKYFINTDSKPDFCCKYCLVN